MSNSSLTRVSTSIQAKKMREVIDELFTKDKTAQIAVMGDFNSQERETPFRIISGEFATHDDALISIATTIPNEKRYSFIGEHGHKLIDYILISKSLQSAVKSFSILNEKLSYHSNKPPTPTYVESDHAPLVVELV
ncbi:MAG: hypothetical protein AAB777_02080 [Patescibacteria group bacterium]